MHDMYRSSTSSAALAFVATDSVVSVLVSFVASRWCILSNPVNYSPRYQAIICRCRGMYIGVKLGWDGSIEEHGWRHLSDMIYLAGTYLGHVCVSGVRIWGVPILAGKGTYLERRQLQDPNMYPRHLKHAQICSISISQQRRL